MRLNPLPGMHRIVDRRADWQHIPQEDWEPWHVIADATFGVVTPGNAITLAGAAMTYAGLKYIEQDRLALGTSLVVAGRVGDLLDGKVADITDTKSPTGEILDAFLDSRLLAVALPIFESKGLIKPEHVKGIGEVTVEKFVGSGVAKLSGIELHADRNGKFGMFRTWGGLVVNLESEILKQNDHKVAGKLLRFEGDREVGKGIAMMARSAARYTDAAFELAI